jgi:hypothetical protein
MLKLSYHQFRWYRKEDSPIPNLTHIRKPIVLQHEMFPHIRDGNLFAHNQPQINSSCTWRSARRQKNRIRIRRGSRWNHTSDADLFRGNLSASRAYRCCRHEIKIPADFWRLIRLRRVICLPRPSRYPPACALDLPLNSSRDKNNAV